MRQQVSEEAGADAKHSLPGLMVVSAATFIMIHAQLTQDHTQGTSMTKHQTQDHTLPGTSILDRTADTSNSHDITSDTAVTPTDERNILDKWHTTETSDTSNIPTATPVSRP